MFAYTIPFMALLITLVAAVTDIKYLKIRNTLTVLGLLSGLFLNTVVFGVKGIVDSFLSVVIIFFVFIFFSTDKINILGIHSMKAMGMGDLKLLMSLGAVLRLDSMLIVILISFSLALIIYVVKNIGKKPILSFIFEIPHWLKYSMTKKSDGNYTYGTKIKLAPCIFLGCCIYYILKFSNII